MPLKHITTQNHTMDNHHAFRTNKLPENRTRVQNPVNHYEVTMDTVRTQNPGDYRGIPSCMDKINSSRESIVTPIEKTNLNTYHTIV